MTGRCGPNYTAPPWTACPLLVRAAHLVRVLGHAELPESLRRNAGDFHTKLGVLDQKLNAVHRPLLEQRNAEIGPHADRLASDAARLKEATECARETMRQIDLANDELSERQVRLALCAPGCPACTIRPIHPECAPLNRDAASIVPPRPISTRMPRQITAIRDVAELRGEKYDPVETPRKAAAIVVRVLPDGI